MFIPILANGSLRSLASVFCLALLLAAPNSLATEEIEAPSTASEASGEATEPTNPRTFLDTVTVAATLSERTLADTPGTIDVIRSEEISELGYTGLADLVRFAPGVEVDGDLTRLGTNGFSIRGVGGNRVKTRIDGIPTAEQFDFGPLSVNQYSIDLDTLESVEIVRSAGSALYGSDALGGVVSLVTRNPRGYLGQERQYLGLRLGHDSRADETSGSLVYALGNETWQSSLAYTHRDGAELTNQGTLDNEDFTRTAPNPIDRKQGNALLKLSRMGESSQLEIALEGFDAETETEVLSGRNPGSPFASAVRDFDAVDTQERLRLSVEQSLVRQSLLVDSVLWRAYWQAADTEQQTAERRESDAGLSQRDGLLTFDQKTSGFDVEARKSLGVQMFTYGLTLRRDDFDQLRDRAEVFLDSGAPVPTSLVFPTKYFPQSEVSEVGAFFQAELNAWSGRLRLIPGLRYDHYEVDADENDAIFLDGNPGTPSPVDLVDIALSPKLGAIFSLTDAFSLFAQYARGFRAPPMSAINNGFTNQAGGYRTLANPDLEAETSDSLEIGLRGHFKRGSFNITAFDNRYEDFIETVVLGFNPIDFLVDFQPQNVNAVEISGIEIATEVRFSNSWRWRAAFAAIEGDNVTDDELLESISPPRLVNGLRYAPQSGRWGFEGTLTAVSAKRASDLPRDSTQFLTPSYEVFDLAAWIALSSRVTLQATGWNLTDETYWQWTHARGRTAGAFDLDRYTSPGRSFGLQARLSF